MGGAKAFGVGLYAELSYHHEVWDYHERMVECVARGDFNGGHQALRDHMTLRYATGLKSRRSSGRQSQKGMEHASFAGVKCFCRQFLP